MGGSKTLHICAESKMDRTDHAHCLAKCSDIRPRIMKVKAAGPDANHTGRQELNAQPLECGLWIARP